MNGLRQRPTATLWGTSPPVSSCSAGAFLRSALWSVGFRCARGSILSPSGGRPPGTAGDGRRFGADSPRRYAPICPGGDPESSRHRHYGKNEALRWELQQAYPSFTVLGYTDRVAEYMAKADLLLTKAGGITTFEAIHAGTPLCLPRPFLMQEEANARYVEQHGFGTVLWQKGYEVETLLALLQNPEELADMRRGWQCLCGVWTWLHCWIIFGRAGGKQDVDSHPFPGGV